MLCQALFFLPVVRSLHATYADAAEVTADAAAAREADGLVVPGVGAFAACMTGLTGVGGPALIRERLADERPTLAICVGHQVLFASGVEHGVRTDGCGIWPGQVERLAAARLPHMGWNTVLAPASSGLFAGVAGEAFYFVHSYAATEWSLEITNPKIRAPRVTWAEHGQRFVAAVENGPLSATQFHPEKSGDAGATLLENWVRSL